MPDTQHDTFREAIGHHQAGRRDEARRLYKRILSRDDRNADALHLLGLLSHEDGDHPRAVKYFKSAIRERDDQAPFHYNLGLALQATGDLTGALAAFHRAIALRPAYPAALSCVGMILTDQGDPQAALPFLEQAVLYAPTDPTSLNNLGSTLILLKRDEEAVAMLGRALAEAPGLGAAHDNHFDALLRLGGVPRALQAYADLAARRPDAPVPRAYLGNLAERQGRLDDALEHYRAAMALGPDLLGPHLAAGRILMDRGDLEEGLALLDQAILKQPDQTAPYLAMGQALFALSFQEAAVICFEKALAIDPTLIGAKLETARVRIGQCQFDVGQRLLDQVLEAAPDLPQGLLALAGLHERRHDRARAREVLARISDRGLLAYAISAARLADTAEERREALGRLEHHLQGTAWDRHQAAELHFAIADVLHQLGEYAAAWPHYDEANRLRNAGQIPDLSEDLVRRIMTELSPERWNALPRARPQGEQAIFIVGMPRSGTSLVEQILASHPLVHGAGELEYVRRILVKVQGRTTDGTEYPEYLAQLGAESYTQMGAEYLRLIGDLAPGAARVTDKMPGNFAHLGAIRAMLPEAKIIHCVRDPLDIGLSLYRHSFAGSHPYSYSLEGIANELRLEKRVMAHYRDTLGIEMFDLVYEDLVRDQEGVTRALLQYLGLPWDPAVLRFWENDRVVATASWQEVRSPIYASGVGGWRRYESELAPLRALLAAD